VVEVLLIPRRVELSDSLAGATVTCLILRMFAEHVSIMCKFETKSSAVEIEGDSDSISKIDLVSVADARGPSAFFVFVVDYYFVGGFVPAALSKSCLRGSQPSVSCSCPLLLVLVREEEYMGVLHAAEIKRQDQRSADTGTECSTIVGVLAGATSTCVILHALESP
jgi:hypothetical protein